MSDDPDLDSAYALETPEDNRRFYKGWARDYDRVFVDETSYALPELVARAYLTAGGGWPCLDVGCGTGAVAEAMGGTGALDGLDISPEMLDIARSKGIYRSLYEVDLTLPLPLDPASYAGFVSAGTFTHGHVGPEALPPLTLLLRPGGLAVFSVKTEVWNTKGFPRALAALEGSRLIGPPQIEVVPVYRDPAKAPEGHGADTARLVSFRRT